MQIRNRSILFLAPAAVLAFVAASRVAAFQSPATGTNLVTLNVVAYDNHGQPVDDLKGEDFQISDQGKTQKITSFQHVENAKAPIVILFDLLNNDFENRGNAAKLIIRGYFYFFAETGNCRKKSLPANRLNFDKL